MEKLLSYAVIINFLLLSQMMFKSHLAIDASCDHLSITCGILKILIGILSLYKNETIAKDVSNIK